jgi:hypothetical protein
MSSNQYTAVFFCEDRKITREMFYAEFEAFLDSVVPFPEYAGREIKAIYVQVSPQLKVLAAVYFLVGFDGAGNADRRWNLPLQQLADQAEVGPNLGAGLIRLACRSQCPVSWYAQSLWDPDMVSEPNDFALLCDIVKQNRLGFRKVEAEDIEDAAAPPILSTLPFSGIEASESDKLLAESLVQFLRRKLQEEEVAERGATTKNHRLLLTTQKNQFEDEINLLEEQHSEEVRQMQQKFHESQQVIEEQKRQNKKLQRSLKEQLEALAKTKQLFEQKLAEKQEVGASELDTLKQDFANELKRATENLTHSFNETLAAKNLEILSCNEEKKDRDAEIARLNAERIKLISQGGEQFLQRLAENKVSFVAYHQGSGHINIGIDEIGEYLANPMAYVAHYCKVPESVYRLWLKHHENPVCEVYSETKGATCGKHLKPVLNPSQFVVGRSDRCPLHWTFGEEAK